MRCAALDQTGSGALLGRLRRRPMLPRATCANFTLVQECRFVRAIRHSNPRGLSRPGAIAPSVVRKGVATTAKILTTAGAFVILNAPAFPFALKGVPKQNEKQQVLAEVFNDLKDLRAP